MLSERDQRSGAKHGHCLRICWELSHKSRSSRSSVCSFAVSASSMYSSVWSWSISSISRVWLYAQSVGRNFCIDTHIVNYGVDKYSTIYIYTRVCVCFSGTFCSHTLHAYQSECWVPYHPPKSETLRITYVCHWGTQWDKGRSLLWCTTATATRAENGVRRKRRSNVAR